MSAKGKTQAKMQPTAVDSHPKYSEMILEAIRDNKEQGKLNVSRPAIQKFVTAKYKLDPTQASRHVNLNLKKMLESGAIKPASAAGRKLAGYYRLGQSLGGKKIADVSERKVTKLKKVTKTKALNMGQLAQDNVTYRSILEEEKDATHVVSSITYGKNSHFK